MLDERFLILPDGMCAKCSLTCRWDGWSCSCDVPSRIVIVENITDQYIGVIRLWSMEIIEIGNVLRPQ